MTLIIKTFRIINVLFIVEMIMLSLGLKLGLLSFGIEVQAAMTELFIMLALMLSIITLIALKTPETKTKKILVCITGIIMVFVGVDFILDNGFRIAAGRKLPTTVCL